MKLSLKLLTVAAFASIVCIIIAAGVLYGAARSRIENQVKASQLSIAQQTIGTVDRLLQGRQTDLQILANEDQVRRVLTNNNDAAKTLTDFTTIEPSWTALTVLDLQGQTKLATEATDRNLLTSQPALKPLYDQARTGATVHSDALTDPGGHQPILAYLAPIRDASNHIIGVMVGELSWQRIQTVLQGVHGPTAYLIDKAGQQIGSNDAKLTLPGPDYHTAALFTTAASLHGSGSAIIAGPTAGHAPVVVSYATEPGFQGYAGSGWILALASPVATATTAAFQLTLLLIAVFFIIVAVGIAAIILFVNRSFLRPIRSLSAAVTRITLGDLSQTVPVGSQDELGALGRSFNEMTHQLAATHRGLKATTKAAEEALAQLQSSINGLRQGFILTDAQGKVLLLNAAARDMVRPQGGDKSAHPSLEAVAKVLPESLELIDKVNQTIADRQASKFPDIALSGRFLNLYLSPVVHEDDSIGCVLLLEDITEERILQRSRDEFFSIASHELRTPLTAIRGNTSMIQQYYAEALKDPSLGEMVTDIHESAVRLIEIVNDFLDASRLEQGKMQLTPEAFAIEPVIEKITYEMAGLSRDKKIYLKFANKLGTLPMVYADQNRVKQIIYNLIGNAMKFTDKGGVTITGEPDKAGLKVRVTDTGQGITPEGQQILFHKFQQSATSILTRDNTRGTGLGLYISKLLVEHMGGSIKLESSEAGKGSVFSFTLPLATEEQKKQKPATAPAAATATPAPRLANDQVKPDTKPNDEKAPHPGPKPDAK